MQRLRMLVQLTALSTLASIGGCAGERLRFDVEETRRDAGTLSDAGGDADGARADAERAAPDIQAVGEDLGASVDPGGGTATEVARGSSDTAHDDVASAPAPAPFDVDPVGHPTGSDEWASGCASGQVELELCGTGLDEDCDGTVDELAEIGTPCTPASVRMGCDVRAYTVCEAGTRNLLCVPVGCAADEVEPVCGNGFVEAGEQCDFHAVGETLGVTCTSACERQLFKQCVFSASGPSDDVECEQGTTCSSWVGACMPTVGGRYLRCPEIPIFGADTDPEAPTAFYPMIETEDGQCWISCSHDDECPSSLSDCYMGFCVVDL